MVFMVGLVSVIPSFGDDTLHKDPNHIYICTFNVYKLGSVDEKYTSLEEEGDEDNNAPPPTFAIPQRIQNLAKVLDVGRFDLVVFQEVTDGQRGRAAMADLTKELHDKYNLNYQFFMSDYIGQGLMAEAIAFMYNPAVVKPEQLPSKTSLVENIEIPGRDLVRTQWEAGNFDFTLISAHLAWGNEAHRDAGYAKINEIFRTQIPSQYSDDPDIIVLGDFNRFGKGYDSVKELKYDPNQFLAPNVTFFDPAFSVKKYVTKASITGKGVPNDNKQLVSTTVANTNSRVYDMILISNDVKEEFPPRTGQAVYSVDFGIIHFDEPNGFGYQQGADALEHNDLKEAYSDHRPLWMRFKVNTGHNDDPPGGVDMTPPTAHSEYVATRHGSRFHRPTCRFVEGRVIYKRWNNRESAAAELLPCGVCNP
jgi:endonuclease/exonuclease/phosphatase family metal-dependent hydrolase